MARVRYHVPGILLLTLSGLVGGCGKPAAMEAPPPATVNVAQPEVKKVQDYLEFTGRVAAIESVEVRARVAGYLTNIAFKDGQDVKAGELLFEIDKRPFELDRESAKAQLESAKARHKLASDTMTRIQPLVAKGAASQLELDTAIARRDEAQGAIDDAQSKIQQAELNIDYATIKAPIAGRMSRPQVTVGNLIGNNTLLSTLVSVKPAYIYYDIDEATLQRYQQRLLEVKASYEDVYKAKMPIWASLGNDRFDFEGTVDFINNQIDPATGTMQVRGVFPNKDELLVPGAFVRVRARQGPPAEALLVPDRAVGRTQDRRYVLVVNDKNVVEYRAVESGGLFEGMRAISKGLKPGEWVIVDGQQMARPGKPVAPKKMAAEETTPAQPAAPTTQTAAAEFRMTKPE